jgi:hypothetical protein
VSSGQSPAPALRPPVAVNVPARVADAMAPKSGMSGALVTSRQTLAARDSSAQPLIPDLASSGSLCARHG